MRLVRLRDLLVSFLPDGRVLVRSGSTGRGVQGPPFLVAVLAACSEPRSREEIARGLGPQAAHVFEQLAAQELLVDPQAAASSPVIFGNYAGVEVHRRMLVDERRLELYGEALRAVVKPGDVVVDAGSGTGVLAVQAALAGAARVYAIEKTEFALGIPQVAADSGVGDKVVVVRSDFSTVELPEKADVLVTETFGAWAFGEGMMPDLAACIRHNLKLDGVVVPHAVSLYLAPLAREPDILLRPFRARDDGVDLTSLLPEARERSHIRWCEAEDVGAEALVARVSMPCDGTFSGEVELQGPCEALVGFYDLHMAPGLDLSTSPRAPWTHWKQSVIPVALGPGRHRLYVEAGPSQEDARTLLATLTTDDGTEHRVRFR